MNDHGSFWNWLGTDGGDLPIHLPIGVNAAGQGPVSDATAHHFVCWCGDVECPLTHVLALADAHARADERLSLVLAHADAATARLALAHAEAVAAKLVEVICDDDLVIAALRDGLREVRRQRDAARAEAERLRSPEWEAEVRADERARAYPGREVRSQLIGAYAQLSHAEAVAAKLVEVICEQEADRANWMDAAYQYAKAQRDAARAEVAALRKQEWAEPYRRDVLAVLRAKVEGLEHDATCSFIPQDGPCDCVRGAVLALLDEEEAQP